jgi:fatty-acid desaturase
VTSSAATEISVTEQSPDLRDHADPAASDADPRRKHRHLLWLGVFAGVVLAVIGVRFLVDPRAAQHTFGLGKEIVGRELHQVIGLRDLWLGALAILLAALRDWRGLALWLGLGVVVCVADAAVVASVTGKWWAVAFHLGSAVFCGWLGVACWRVWRRTADVTTDRPARGVTDGGAAATGE